jgi:hypothetical protein
MNANQAREIALVHVGRIEAAAGLPFVLLDGSTREFPFGWLFFYDSKRHQETQDIEDAIAGNAPFVVTRADGKIHTLGTAMPVAHYLREFEGY